MSITSIEKDLEARTMTIEAEFDVPVDRAWQLWADPRQLERWWGPPTYPATVVDHDLTPGGTVTYFMTGPEGDEAHGWWRVTSVDPPRGLEFEDGFADDAGEPNLDLPVTTTRVVLADRQGDGTRMTIESRFASSEDMARLLEMGMDEGISAALGQIDDILAGAPQG